MKGRNMSKGASNKPINNGRSANIKGKTRYTLERRDPYSRRSLDRLMDIVSTYTDDKVARARLCAVFRTVPIGANELVERIISVMRAWVKRHPLDGRMNTILDKVWESVQAERMRRSDAQQERILGAYCQGAQDAEKVALGSIHKARQDPRYLGAQPVVIKRVSVSNATNAMLVSAVTEARKIPRHLVIMGLGYTLSLDDKDSAIVHIMRDRAYEGYLYNLGTGTLYRIFNLLADKPIRLICNSEYLRNSPQAWAVSLRMNEYRIRQ